MPAADRLGNIPGIDLVRLEELAELYTSKADAAALLGADPELFDQLLADRESGEAEAWRRGRARARLKIRQSQFSQMEKNASLAIHLGKEILGQNGGDTAGPVTFVVDTGIRRDRTETD